MGKNRSIEAKRIKYLRQQKSRPRSLRMNNGYMKASQIVDRSKIPKEARSLFEYRQRLQPTDTSREVFITAVLDALYPNFSNPKPRERETEALRLKVNKEEPINRSLVVVNGKFTKLVMVADKDFTCIQFFEYQRIAGIVKRSITYGSYDRAMNVFHLQTIRWKETIIIPNVETSPFG